MDDLPRSAEEIVEQVKERLKGVVPEEHPSVLFSTLKEIDIAATGSSKVDWSKRQSGRYVQEGEYLRDPVTKEAYGYHRVDTFQANRRWEDRVTVFETYSYSPPWGSKGYVGDVAKANYKNKGSFRVCEDGLNVMVKAFFEEVVQPVLTQGEVAGSGNAQRPGISTKEEGQKLDIGAMLRDLRGKKMELTRL